MLKSVFLFLALLFMASGPLFADPSLEAALSASDIRQDETTRLIVEIAWPSSEGQYTFTLPQISPRNLVLKQQGEAQEMVRREGETWAKKTFIFYLQPVAAGAASVGPLTIRFYNPQSFSTGLLEVPEQKLNVQASAGAGSLWAGALVFLAALSTLGFLLFRRLKNSSRQPVVQESPEDQICREIDAFMERGGDNQPRELASFLHSKLRSYLAGRYHLEKAEREETLTESLASKNLSVGELNTIKKLFADLREARYAGGEPEPGALRSRVQEVKRYLSSKKVAGGG